MAIAISGIVLAVLFYQFLPKFVEAASKSLSGIHKLLSNKWWVDELYDVIVIKPLHLLSQSLFTLVDRVLIDGTVNGAGYFVVANGEIARRIQTGRISFYAGFMFFGSLMAIVFWMIL